MLDHTENQQLHDLIVHVAPLLPGPLSSASSADASAEDVDPPPFGPTKLERILDRVYNRLADEAESADPRLRQLITETVVPSASDEPSFSAGKIRRHPRPRGLPIGGRYRRGTPSRRGPVPSRLQGRRPVGQSTSGGRGGLCTAADALADAIGATQPSQRGTASGRPPRGLAFYPTAYSSFQAPL